MDTTTINEPVPAPPPRLFSGPSRYEPRTSWGPFAAAVAAVVVFLGQILGVIAASLAIKLAGGLHGLAPDADDALSLASPFGLALALASQLASLVLVWLLAGWRADRRQVLALDTPSPRWGTLLGGGVLVLAATGVVELVLYGLIGFDYKADTEDVAQGMLSPYWPLAVVMAVVMAPLWEELTVRGFLLPALARTRLGFWGAAVVSNTAWTALHGNYSVAGLVSVFTAGMVMSWLLWRTGSLRAPIVAHAITNMLAVTFAWWAATQT